MYLTQFGETLEAVSSLTEAETETYFGLNNVLVDLSKANATLQIDIFTSPNQVGLYPRNVKLIAITPVSKDSNNYEYPNYYASLSIVDADTTVYVVDDEINPTRSYSGRLLDVNVVINDLGYANKALKFIFEDSKGIIFSYITSKFILNYKTDIVDTPVGDVRDCLGLQGTVTQNDDDLNIYSDTIHNYDAFGNITSSFYNYGISHQPVHLVSETAQGITDRLYIHAKPFKNQDSTVLIDVEGKKEVLYIPEGAFTTPVLIGHTKSLPYAANLSTDIAMFSLPLDTSNTINCIYGEDTWLFIGVATKTARNASSDLDVANLSLIHSTGEVTGALAGGSYSDTLQSKMLKVWKFNIPATLANYNDLNNTELALQFKNASGASKTWTKVSLRNHADQEIPSLPNFTLKYSANSLALTWLSLTTDGLNLPIPLSSYSVGPTSAISTRVNTTKASVSLRVTDLSSYVITGVQLSQLTLVPAQLTAGAKASIYGDFSIGGDLVSVVNNTTNIVATISPTKTSLNTLEELTFNVVFRPAMKIINIPAMVSSNLTAINLDLVNTRKLKIQVMGYKVGGSNVPVAIGAPLIITGKAV